MAANKVHLENRLRAWLFDEVVVTDECFTYDEYYDYMVNVPILTRTQFAHYVPRIVEQERKRGWRGCLSPYARVERFRNSEKVFQDRHQETDTTWSGDGSQLLGIGRTTARTDNYVGTKSWTVYRIEIAPDPTLHPKGYAEWKNSLL